MDALDRKIIAELQDNGKATSKELERRLKVSDGTIRFRMKRLVQQKLLRITALINPFSFKDGILGFVGMELEKRTHQQTMEKISRMKGVLTVCNVTGRFDLLTEFFFESRQELKKFLIEDLSKISGINRTETYIILDAIDKWIELPKPN
jgi:DNA-binding Lrp family transcriptional regulator